MKSGFTAFVGLPGNGLTAKDTVPPGVPTVTSIMGGFKQVSIFIQPPNDADFEAVDVFISDINNFADAGHLARAGSTASDSIQFVATQYASAPLQNGTTYYFWFQSRDHSGNVSAIIPGQFSAIGATTIPIGAGDVIQTSALITQFAQIQNGLIQDAHISNLSANKITAGTLSANISIGVGQHVFLLGNAAAGQNVIVVTDNNRDRVQLGKLGPGPQDYGLQIFGADGSLWHSLTEGTQTAGRQNVTTITHDISLDAGSTYANIWWAGAFTIQNTTTTIVVRVTAMRRTVGGGAKAPVPTNNLTFIDYAIQHNFGKVMVATVSLANALNVDIPIGRYTATATIQVDFW
jgi:hypothetical protein